VTLRRPIGFAFIACVLMYGVVAHFIIGGAEAVPVAPVLVVAFYAASLGTLVAGLIVFPRLNLPQGFIVSMALCEAPAILGLVLALLSRSPRDLFVLGGSSVLALLYLTLRQEA
jgi:hypothetical protein